jgi:hypothetical protein
LTQLAIQKAFAPIKKSVPAWVSNPIRSLATAFLVPVMFGYRTGFFRSCFERAAVSKNGEPLPWYTYSSIDFLKYRSYADKIILEFGGGQSTFWWAKRAKRVVTLEGNLEWYRKLESARLENVDLSHVTMEDGESNAQAVRDVLASRPFPTYDVIVIDGLYRQQMIGIACQFLSQDGIIVCDNAERFEIYARFKERGFNRVDFYGNAPGVVLPHCTSIYFRPTSFVFDPVIPIHVIADE